VPGSISREQRQRVEKTNSEKIRMEKRGTEVNILDEGGERKVE